MHLRQCGHDFVLPNIKYDFIARSLFLLCLNFTSLFYVNVYVLYELFFFIDSVVRVLFM